MSLVYQRYTLPWNLRRKCSNQCCNTCWDGSNAAKATCWSNVFWSSPWQGESPVNRQELPDLLGVRVMERHGVCRVCRVWRIRVPSVIVRRMVLIHSCVYIYMHFRYIHIYMHHVFYLFLHTYVCPHKMLTLLNPHFVEANAPFPVVFFNQRPSSAR